MLMSTDENELLVLGDGDFSYSASLVSSRLCKYNLTSTVFLSEQDIISTYGDDVLKNVRLLEEHNVRVLFSVDATNLPSSLCQRQYDSVHFNFPHTGGKGKISENRKLLVHIFKSLQTAVKSTGNIEIALLPGQGGTPADGEAIRSKGNSWNIQEAAAQSGFILYCVEKFEADFYNLTGYRGRSKAFFCDSGLRHKFKLQPFRSSSLTGVLQSVHPGSYIDRYSRETNILGQSFSYRCTSAFGGFNELFSIILDHTNQSDCERMSKRAKLEDTETIDRQILKVTGLESKKEIFYPINQIKVLYPPCIKHDVSMWTDSSTTPNIVPVLLECVGLALHKVEKREPEPFFNAATQKYSHCFSITYSHPYEALSEQFVKHLAHVTVRNSLAASGFDLH